MVKTLCLFFFDWKLNLIFFLFLFIQLLLGFESGTVVVWSLRGKTAEQRCICSQVRKQGPFFNTCSYTHAMVVTTVVLVP